jgi:hypothetical protein
MEQGFTLDKTSWKRKCFVCGTNTVYRIKGDNENGACEICNTKRAIPEEPPDGPLCDLQEPEQAEFFTKLMNQCTVTGNSDDQQWW